jgi:ElaB/YqjD/DUF883 family membrane-anchored ribosome-binding protein
VGTGRVADLVDYATPEEVQQLREELRHALADLEEIPEKIENRFKPQSVEEAKELEAKLEAALGEVRTHREQLEKRRPGQRKKR